MMSPVQRHLLALFYGQPGRVYQNHELISLVGSGVGAVHRQVKLFEAARLIRRIPLGNQRYFTVNSSRADHRLLVELVRADIGLVAPIREALLPLSGRLQGAWIHGAAACGRDEPASALELVVIAAPAIRDEVDDALVPARRWLARPIEITVVSAAEWLGMGDEPDLFVAAIVNGPRVAIIEQSASLK